MVLPVVFALVTANLVNLFFNYVLIFGKLGFPAMGVDSYFVNFEGVWEVAMGDTAIDARGATRYTPI